MSLIAGSHVSTLFDSVAAGKELVSTAMRPFSNAQPLCAIVYSTVCHDQQQLLRTVRSTIGNQVCVLGCSTQGISGRGVFSEASYVAGIMLLGGTSLVAKADRQAEINVNTYEKGKRLAETIQTGLGQEPKVIILHYDPLVGANMEGLLAGIGSVVNAPIIGGGAAQPWGPMTRTFQYFSTEVTSNSVVAVGLAGLFDVHTCFSHGTEPTGLTMRVTRAEGNAILELDGQPALDVWNEITGSGTNKIRSVDETAAWAVGIALGQGHRGTNAIRAAFGFDTEKGSILLQVPIVTGTEVMFHHRTVETVLDGTAAMGLKMAESLKGRQAKAFIGFECGARTTPFLGLNCSQRENLDLQQRLGMDAAWLGMLAWGEIAPFAGKPEFFNYTYPLLALAESSQ